MECAVFLRRDPLSEHGRITRRTRSILCEILSILKYCRFFGRDYSIDIPYIRPGRRFIYLAVIMDVFTRCVRGWHLSRSLEQQLTLDALDMALAKVTLFIFHVEAVVLATRYTLLNPAGCGPIFRRTTPSLAGTMDFRAGGSLERQIRCYRESHRSGYANPRFNVVALLVHSTSTLGIPYPASLLNHGDTPLPQRASNLG